MNVSCPQCSTIYRVDPAKVPQGGVRARCSTCSGVIPVGIRAATPPRPSPQVDAIGAAFGNRPASPPPFNPSASRTAAPVRQTPGPQPRQTPATPARSAPVTPVATPRVPTPAAPSPALGAALPPLRPTPRTPWPSVAEPAAPISVPPVTPPSSTVRTPTPPGAAPAAAAPAPAVPVAAAIPSAEPASRRPINPFLSRDPSLRAKRLARALVSDMVAYYPAKHAEGLEKGTLKELFRDEIKKSYDEYVSQVGADFARTTTHFQESLNEVLGAGKKIF